MKIALLTTDNREPFKEYDEPQPWFGMAPEALLAGLAGLPELEVHVISCIRQPVKSPEKIADNIWFHSLCVPKIGWVRTGYLGCVLAVRRLLKQIQPDLVHGHGSESEGAMCAAFSGYPNLITLLGVMREVGRIVKARPRSFFWITSLLESVSLRRTLGVLCNSRYTEEKVRSRTPKTWLVPNAIRECFFLKPLPATRPPGCTILNVGTILNYKRQNELLDVVEQLHAEGLDFDFRFIGKAYPNEPYAARFLERVRNLPRVSHQQFMPVAELMDQYDRATALVHVSAIESFGLVVAEALARDLKFLGFGACGVADIVEGVPGAEALADGDWPGLKAGLARWIRAGFPRPASAQLMKSRYHPAEIARQHLSVYREVLGRKP